LQGGSERIDRVIEELSKLPTIGRKTAQRLALYLIKAPADEVAALVDALMDMKRNVGYCSRCGALTEEDPCSICADERRDRRTICVVEEPGDVLAIERTGEYRGLYHVLHGRLSPLDGIGPEDLAIKELVERVERLGIEEVIIATNPTVEGEATCNYIAGIVDDMGVEATTIARGVPMGSDLEFADGITLARAFKGRSRLK
jgi:recombination protein RecR